MRGISRAISIALSLPFLLIMFSLNSYSKSDGFCKKFISKALIPNSKIETSYCLYTYENEDLKATKKLDIVSLHGKGDKPESAQNTFQGLTKYFETKNVKKVRILWPQGEVGWWSDGPNEKSKKYEKYVFELLSEMFDQYGFAEEANLAIMGHSMGGFGALKFGLKYPNMFQSISAIAPGILQAPLYNEGYNFYGTNPKVNWHRDELKAIYPDERTWYENDPVSVARKASQNPLPPIFVNVGLNDEWEFYKGARRLVQSFKDAHIDDFVYQEVPGLDHLGICSTLTKHLDFHLSQIKE